MLNDRRVAHGVSASSPRLKSESFHWTVNEIDQGSRDLAIDPLRNQRMSQPRGHVRKGPPEDQFRNDEDAGARNDDRPRIDAREIRRDIEATIARSNDADALSEELLRPSVVV